jgi:hypothetical protein
MPAGNCSVLVVLDSRRVAERACADRTVFAALDHFGPAYEALECADHYGLPPGHVSPRAAYILAHDGAGAELPARAATEIAEAVRAGAGLISFDREVEKWPDCLRALVPAPAGVTTVEQLSFPAPAGFITHGHAQGDTLSLLAPLQVVTFEATEGFQSLLQTPEGACVIGCAQVGDGRVVVFGTGERIYADGILGHTRGIDGLMWRSLVWAAAKPFPMRCIPPYIAARMDDCHGTHTAFRYVDVLNRHGIGPNLGLFIDEMGPTDWAAARRLFEKGGADFSMHAFRDDFYKASPKWRPYGVLPDKPDLSDGGKHTAFEGLSVDHQTGRDLDDETVRRNFKRMDDAFARAGIKHSRVLNSHFGEIGWRAVPLFLERGVEFPCNNSVVGQLYGNQPPWRPKPYGVRGPNGRHGLVLDRCPRHPGFTFIGSAPSHLGGTYMITDILYGHTPFYGESDRSRPDAAIARGIANLKLELDNLAFGEIFCHEERIDCISLEEWEYIVEEIIRGISDCDWIPAEREQVSVICKRILDSSLAYADITEAGLHCEFSGVTDGPSPLTLWVNEGNTCRRLIADIPQIEGFLAMDLPESAYAS